jgi:outer membrane lipoprotein SlyB
MRACCPFLTAAALFAIALSLAGCAQPRPAPQIAASDAIADTLPPDPPGHTLGTIVARRPLAEATWRTGVLSALRDTAAPEAPADAEFIVAERDGATLSVVQPDQAGLQPGARVRILFSARTRIATTN